MRKLPRIGTCVMFSDMGEMAEKFSALRENGFQTCQILSWQPGLWTEENACRMKELLEE